MIRSIDIAQFRGIRQGRLDDMTRLTVLVGPNGCGKSTVLDAVLVGASPTPLKAVARVIARREVVPSAEQWLFWGGRSEGEASITVETTSDTARLVGLKLVAHEDGLRMVYWHACNPPEAPRPTQSGVLRYGGEGEPRQDRLLAPLDPIAEIRLVEPSATRRQPPLHELYTAAVRAGRRSEVRDILKVLTRAQDYEILTEGPQPVVHLVFPEYSVPVELAGDGIAALARLALELAARVRGVVLVEEPEAHMHPGALVQVAKAAFAVARRDVQLIISTHSLELIDMLVAEPATSDELELLSVFSLRCDAGELRSYRLTGSQVADARGRLGDDLR